MFRWHAQLSMIESILKCQMSPRQANSLRQLQVFVCFNFDCVSYQINGATGTMFFLYSKFHILNSTVITLTNQVHLVYPINQSCLCYELSVEALLDVVQSSFTFNFCFRNGLFSTRLLQDFPLLLRHLCLTDTLFASVHPLQKMTQTCDHNFEPGTVRSTKTFHQKMIQHCSANGFMNFLYYYLDFYRYVLKPSW